MKEAAGPPAGEHISRRGFLKLSGAAAALAALNTLESCAAAPVKNVPAIDYGRDILIRNCTVVDVVRGTALPGRSILIRRGVIHAVEAGDLPAPQALSLDAAGSHVIPGLIDAHCHSTVTAAFSIETVDVFRHMAFQKRQYALGIEHGITTYRDMGAFPLSLHKMVRDINSGSLIGPRVLYCNSLLNIMGGHPDVPPSDAHPLANLAALMTGMIMTNFKDLKALREVIDTNARGASFIKLTMDNRSTFCRTGEIPVYTDEMLAYIFDYAAKKCLPVSCHVQRKFGFDRAMKYPFNSIEHVVSDTELSDSDIELMVRRNVSVVPTMTIALSYLMEEAFDEIPDPFRNDFIEQEMKIRRAYLAGEAPLLCDPVIHAKNMEALKDYRRIGIDNLWKNKKFLVNPLLYFGMVHYGTRSLMKMRSAGVNIGFGIDAGMPFAYFGSQYRELEFLARAGFRNDEILRIATINSARILGMQDKIGTIEKGKFADLVFLDGDPLADIGRCRTPRIVMKEGKFAYSAQQITLREPALPS